MARTNMRRLSSWWRTGMGSDNSVGAGGFSENIQAVVVGDDLKFPPHAAGMGPTTIFAPAIPGVNALILDVPADGGGCWVDFAWISSALTLGPTYFDFAAANPFTVDLIAAGQREMGEVATGCTLWFGQGVAVQTGIKIYRGSLTAGGMEAQGLNPGIFPLYVPPGNHFWAEAGSSAAPTSQGMKWRDV